MDPAAIVPLLAPLLGLLACVLLHVLVSRGAPSLPRPRVLAGSVLAGLAVVGAMALVFLGRSPAWTSPVDLLGSTAVWILAYLALAYCYVFGFYNLGESARRIRLLVELSGAGNKGLTLEELLAVYNARMIVEARLGRLLTGGQVVERGGRYFSKRSPMLYIAKTLSFMKVLFLGAPTEFGPRRH